MKLAHLSSRASTFPSLCAHWVGTDIVVVAGGGGADRSGRENRIELLLADGLEEVTYEVLDGEPVFFLTPATHSACFFAALRMSSIAVYEITGLDASGTESPILTLHNRTGWKDVGEKLHITAVYGCGDYLAFCTVHEDTKTSSLHLWCYSCNNVKNDDLTHSTTISLVQLPSTSLPLRSTPISVVPHVSEKRTDLYVVSRQGEVSRVSPAQIPHILGTATPYNQHPLSSTIPMSQLEPGTHLCASGQEQIVGGTDILRALYPLHLDAAHALAGHFVAHFTGKRSCSLCLLDQCFAPVKTCRVSSSLSCGISRFHEDSAVIFMVLSNGSILTFDALTLARLDSYQGSEDSLLTALELTSGSSRCIVVSPAGVEVCSLRPVNSSLQSAYRTALVISIFMVVTLAIGIYYRHLENTGSLGSHILFTKLNRIVFKKNMWKTSGSGEIRI
ncbi:Hypothetical protein GLP15_1478 [Giardia lamblia P15]|uniref:Uncharacterized protein n=1 Tax=Giardia intestinalis (strain P15) TaxID=658858 RepID=E1EYR0_GIAIA|nr:Hypothetical protein GLP15_1478 [Giardia lamblia P15]